MKSIYLLTSLLLMLISTAAFSQVVLLDQNFESGTLPSGWLRQQSTPSRGWEFGTYTSLSSGFMSFPEHTKFAASNDDKYDNQATTQNVADRDMLITPALNLTTMTSGRLTFSTYYTGAYGSVATVEISIDGGSTWSVLSTVPSLSSWQDLSIDLNGYLNQNNVKIAFVHNDGGEWADGVAVDDVKVFQPTANDVQLVSVDVPASSTVGSVPVTITVKNYGTATLNSFTFSWTADGGATTKTEIVNGLSLAPGATKSVTHNNSLISLTGGEYTLSVSLSFPNGQTDLSANNNGSATVNVTLGTADKFVVIEDHTGAWCQYCPDGTVVLEGILDANDRVIGVGVHNDDAMDFPDGNTVGTAVTGGSFPSGTVDRVFFPIEANLASSRGTWNQYAQQRLSTTSIVSISADNTYVPSTRELTVNVTAEFLSNLTGDYRLNVFIVEDSVTGTGSGYNQVNAYNGSAGHPYYQAGNPIIGFAHRDVARHFMGGAWGQAGVIPNSIVALTPYSNTFTYTLPAGWNTNRMHLVAVVQEYAASLSNREILNALKLDLNSANEIVTNVVRDAAAIDIASITHSVCGGGKEGEIFVTPVGCADCTFTWSNGQTGSVVFSLAPGTYTVTMENNAGVSVTESITIYGPLMLNPTVVSTGGTSNVTLNISGGRPPYTIGWSNGSTSTSVTGLASGVYEITVIDNSGCSTVQNLRVGNAVGINNVADNISFDVYPNPTSGTITVEADLANNTNVSIQVFNTIGALVSETTLSGSAQVREVVDLTAQANGVYIVKVTANGISGVRRLVLNR
jgi:hypothetical protein